MHPIVPSPRDVLVVVDVQVDFLPGGSLGVPGGDAIVPVINRLAGAFETVVLTQDWHPPGHISFASSHAGQAPFAGIELGYGSQILWPDHCVQGTSGAQLSPGLSIEHAQLVIRKGYHHSIDSYSAFMEADRSTATGLAGYLRERGIGRVFVCGLATDYCVGWSALDAAAAGFEVSVVEDASMGIDRDGSMERAWTRMRAAGIARLSSNSIVAGTMPTSRR